MVWHWFRKPAGAIPYRFESYTLRSQHFLSRDRDTSILPRFLETGLADKSRQVSRNGTSLLR